MSNNSTLNQDDLGMAQPLSAGCSAAEAQQPSPWKAPKCTPSSNGATFACLPRSAKERKLQTFTSGALVPLSDDAKYVSPNEIGDPHTTATAFTSHECVSRGPRRICKRPNVPQK